jgi:D-alanyl-D-alanine carboxypeptidase/D-alanyl-D-alanine-endopeptidase (penicillin-binding protein 4)
MKRCLVVCLLFVFYSASAQDIKQKLQEQVQRLVADSQMRAGILGLYVADATTGEEIFSWNGKTGLAPASTQKIITSVAAFELLGRDYRYTTEFWGGKLIPSIKGKQKFNRLEGLFIKGKGDPTLGSWRYSSTTEGSIADSLVAAFRKNNIQQLANIIYVFQNHFDVLTTPGGWIVDDIGNYYGAGVAAVNWKENQFDVKLLPGKKEGDPVKVDSLFETSGYKLRYNQLTTGKRGSGDGAYIYFNQMGEMMIAGTAESGTGSLTISGAAEPKVYLAHRLSVLLKQRLKWKNQFTIEMRQDSTSTSQKSKSKVANPVLPLYTHYSPALDSIVYWFMKRSINLYGEALLKAIAVEKTGVGSTDSGVAAIRRFYKEKGFDIAALKIKDGSGLSPQNRITAEALVKVLLYAKNQSWFPAFEQSFPIYNEMTLKSGTIGGAKSYAGFHTAKDGKQYVVAIIINNYDGLARSIEQKMFKVLDVLK